MRKWLFALIVAFFANVPASYGQGCGSLNPNCIVPTAPVGTSNNQAASTAFVQTAIDNIPPTTPGGSSGQQQYNSNGAFGGFTESGDVAVNTSTGVATIQPGVVSSSKIAANGVANGNIAPGPASTMKGSLNGTATSDIALITCSAAYQITKWVSGTGWQCGVNPVISSRAIAATMNLSAYSVVTTQGYAQPGDGGGGTFENVSTTPLRDQGVLNGTLSAGSGCTNGTYFNIHLTGSATGQGLYATVTASGGVIISVSWLVPGNGFKIGDVLTGTGGFGCTNWTYTVTSLTTVKCSFVDGNSDNFQLVADAGNYLNTRQCGAVVNWKGTDGSATNDHDAIQAALFLAYDPLYSLTNDAGGVTGATVIQPKGASLLCGSTNSSIYGLIVPGSVIFQGNGGENSVLKECASQSSTIHFVALCDPSTEAACFGAEMRDMELFPGGGAAGNTVAMVFSNNDQQERGLDRVVIYAGNRECLNIQIGYGGAATFSAHGFFCTPFNTTSQASAVTLAYGAAVVTIDDFVVESGGSGTAINGFTITSGGIVHITNGHSENIGSPFFVNVTSGSTITHIEHVTGGANCTALVTRQSGSQTGNILVNALTPNGCTSTLNNAGTMTTGNVVGQATM